MTLAAVREREEGGDREGRQTATERQRHVEKEREEWGERDKERQSK